MTPALPSRSPTELPEAQAAAVPSAHATAWYGLHDLAGIEEGDKVLIHSATGGVGQAAVAMAKAAGAEIFATAGSAEKREMLHAMGIEHVYDSRSTEFAELIRKDTDGYGVDVVLNSLPGAAQQAGLELLAVGGRFVEIGKRDIYGDTKMGLFPFRRNLSFYAVDLALLTMTKPAKLRRLLKTIYQQIADGVLPLPETTHYPLEEGATAIRVMGCRRAHRQVGARRPAHRRVHGGAAARTVAGRSGPTVRTSSPAVWADSGCSWPRRWPLPAVVGSSSTVGLRRKPMRCRPSSAFGTAVPRSRWSSVTSPRSETATRLVAGATATGLALRGVLHAAAVVEDATLANITDELVERDWAPKVYGAWHLHEATKDLELDWFCSFSSAAAMVGSPGQGAYAAANSWLDAFTHWRRAQGLPANAVAWGAWAEIGRGQGMAEDTSMAIAPDDGAHAFDVLARVNRGYTGYAPIAGTPWLSAFAQTSRFAEAFKSMGQSRSGTSQFLTELKELPTRGVAGTGPAAHLRADRPDPAPVGRPGPPAVGVRARLVGQPGTPHPRREGDGVRITATDITTIRGLADAVCEKLEPAEVAA